MFALLSTRVLWGVYMSHKYTHKLINMLALICRRWGSKFSFVCGYDFHKKFTRTGTNLSTSNPLETPVYAQTHTQRWIKTWENGRFEIIAKITSIRTMQMWFSRRDATAAVRLFICGLYANRYHGCRCIGIGADKTRAIQNGSSASAVLQMMMDKGERP